MMARAETAPHATVDRVRRRGASPEYTPRAAISGSSLSLRGVTKRWGKRVILDDIDLTLTAGELTWLEGANGVGKTTLLRIATGMIHPQQGKVLLDGFHPERDRPEFLRRVGFLSAGDRALYARLSARRHLRFAANLALIPRREREPTVTRALSIFGIEEFADRRADRLSTGQRQRVRLAMSLLHEPRIVLLDEPLNSLDQDGLGVLHNYLLDLCRRGGAALWSAPTGSQTGLSFDRHFALDNGKLVPQ